MINLADDGTITIDFPDPTGQVTLRAPKFGAYRRLQNEREREIGHMNEKIAGLPKLDPIPDRADQSDTAQAERERLAPIYRTRVLQVQDFSVEALTAIWRLILIGTEDFKALAEPTPPEDTDEWPIELLVDSGDLDTVDGQVVRTNPTIIDSVLRHWGKARYRSGSTAPVPTL